MSNDPRTAEVDLGAVVEFLIDVTQGAQRRDGRPAHTHPIRTCLVLRHLFGVARSEWLAASLLHDMIEDTATSKELIAQFFGEEVAARVEAQTYVGISESMIRDPDERRVLRYDNKLRRIPQWDLGNCLILFVDILDNLFLPNGEPDPLCRALYREFVLNETLPALERRLVELDWSETIPTTLISPNGLYIGPRPLIAHTLVVH